jgi:Mg2+ and Co2+ transporter CorA
LFDADGHDRLIDVSSAELPRSVGERRLLWVDIDRQHPHALDALDDLRGLIDLDARARARITEDTGRASLHTSQDRLHVTLEALEPGDDGRLERREIDLLIGSDVVVSIHHGRRTALNRFLEGFDGETRLGALSAADLLSSLIDEVIGGYYLLAEQLGREIDDLDQRALRGRPNEDLLAALVAVRGRVSMIRRTLAPHRATLAGLARPEGQADEGLGRPWPGLVERLEGALEAVDGARQALLGTYDIHMGRVAQRANDVMRVLTLLSAVLLPGVVLAGIMGMNFKLAFFDTPENFFVVVGAMLGLAGLVGAVAAWRHWL